MISLISIVIGISSKFMTAPCFEALSNFLRSAKSPSDVSIQAEAKLTIFLPSSIFGSGLK